MTHQQRIRALRDEQRHAKALLNVSDHEIRMAAQARVLAIGLEIDAEFLRHQQNAISII